MIIYLFQPRLQQRYYIEQMIHFFTTLQNDNVRSVFILNIEKYGCPPCVHIHIQMYQNTT